MDEAKRTRLAALSPLGAQQQPQRDCKICGAAAMAFDVVDFQKVCSTENPYLFGRSGIPVYYYRCTDCEFLFADFLDDWTNEDFRTYIYNDDYIKVDGDYVEERPRRDGQFFLQLLHPYAGLSVLDYGGGGGVLAAVLCSGGIDAECYDPFSSPARPQRRFDIITCMEVIEHSTNPVATLRDMASLLGTGGCILVGTGLQPPDIATLRTNWWYVAPRNGHVSLQSAASLIRLGCAAGLIAYTAGYLHGFAASPSPASAALLAGIGRPAVSLRLSAPDDTSSAGLMLTSNREDWHDIEDGELCWTAKSEIVWYWTPPFPNCDVQLRLPYILEIEPHFISRSQLLVNGTQVAHESDGRAIKAMASIENEGPVTIKLVTPQLPTPHDLYGSADFRALGIAFPVHQGDPGGSPAAGSFSPDQA